MNNDYNQNMLEFLDEFEVFLKQIDNLSKETVLELYNTLDLNAKYVTENIKLTNPEIRVRLAKYLDVLLGKIVTFDDIYENNTHRNVFTPAIQGYRTWKNVELLKDKGLTGYMLAQELKTPPYMMFLSKNTEYEYLEYLPELNVAYTENEGSAKEYNAYLYANCFKMDILILHGMYPETSFFLKEYRKLRPDGKVYCGLDMNRQWMSEIDWLSDEVKEFANNCDVIATSSSYLRDALNNNPDVPFTCRYLPNAFLNLTNIEIVADAKNKKNTILTVGRIGTTQKNNMELLLAFAKAEPYMKNWTLRLVGPIDDSFKFAIEKYFAALPELRKKVIFTGAINDKKQLYKEYSEAKCFVLTSVYEGGAPNVYAEALVHGCKFITSDIDAADDITNFGELGETYKLHEVDKLAKCLINLAKKETAIELNNHIEKATKYATEEFDWNVNSKKLAFMLFQSSAK